MPQRLWTLVFLICKMSPITARRRVGHSSGCHKEPFQGAVLCTRAWARQRMLVKHFSCSSLSLSPVLAGAQQRERSGSGVGLPTSDPTSVTHQPPDLRGKPAHLYVPWFCHLYNGTFTFGKVPPSKSWRGRVLTYPGMGRRVWRRVCVGEEVSSLEVSLTGWVELWEPQGAGRGAGQVAVAPRHRRQGGFTGSVMRWVALSQSKGQ